ncbi:TIMELESS-interacting protein [Paramormyrops kingsleyae]|uniref:TIMELESS-interacting protein n=1 Tax=Paramormyrops kingsleyae TaxID=1676925 RepID=UPI003B96D0D1
MAEPMESNLFDIPDYENTEDEAFPPFPPPLSPGQDDGEGDAVVNGNGEMAEAPGAKRRFVRRPQPKLNAQRLTSERGLPALRTLFDSVKFKGKGHETEDLQLLMQKMENWAHRLYPKLQFEDFIDRLETLGSKKEVQTCLKRIRLDMPLMHEDFVSRAGEEEEGILTEGATPNEPDPFGDYSSTESAPLSSTSAAAPLTEEQRRRIELNKQLALERRLARRQEGASQLGGPRAAAEEPSSFSAPSPTGDDGESGVREDVLPQDSLQPGEDASAPVPADRPRHDGSD